MAGQCRGSSWKGKRQQQVVSKEMAQLEVPTGLMCVDKCWPWVHRGWGSCRQGGSGAFATFFMCNWMAGMTVLSIGTFDPISTMNVGSAQ